MNQQTPSFESIERAISHPQQSIKRASCSAMLTLAYQSLGVVYGDLSTSPLYVYKTTFSEKLRLREDDEEIFGVLSFIFWTFTLVALFKYIFIVMSADDNGEGLVDIVGRRLGKQKLPYNKNKSFAGSIAMATAGFVASVGYMHYFSMFGFFQESWGMVLSFLVVSVASALVESLPISTKLDDNLTVSLTSFV